MSWRRFFRRARWDRERSEEIESHVQMETDENVARGMREEEARAAARRKFGNRTLVREEIYRMNTIGLVDALARDARYGLRSLRKNPTFTAVALLTLAVGIGANTAVFSVVNRVLLQPLAYPHSEELVSLSLAARGLPDLPGNVGWSASLYFTCREENRTFQQFGLWSFGGASLTGVGEPELPRALFVTYGVLDALRVEPLAGRWFSQADDTPGSPETVILTYAYWQRRFAGDESVVGRTLTIDAKPHTVIGIMPRGFRFQRDPELILPERFERDGQFLGPFGYQAMARLKPGVTLSQANGDLARLVAIWLGKRDARLEPRHCLVAKGTEKLPVPFEPLRKNQFRIALKTESPRHDSDHRVRLRIDRQRAPHHRFVAREAPLPVGVSEDHGLGRTGRVVRLRKPAAGQRFHSQGI